MMSHNRFSVTIATAAFGAFPLFASVAPDPADASTLIAQIDSGSETYSAEIGSSISKLVKKGKGTLVLPNANANFNGDVEIQEGIISAGAIKALGCKNTVEVKNGAQLIATFSSGGQTGNGFPSTQLVIAGDGPDHAGAILYKGSDIGDSLVRNLKLSDSATIGGTQRWGVGYGGVLDLNGFTLTNNACSSAYMFYGTVIKDGPGNFFSKGGTVTLQNNSSYPVKFNGSAENVFTLNAATLHYWGCSVATPWTINVISSATFKIHGNGRWDGPIIGNGGTIDITSDASGTSKATFASNGSICGAKSLTVKSDGDFTATLSGDTHAITNLVAEKGTLVITGGTRHAINSFFVGKTKAKLRFDNAGDVELAAGSSTVCGVPNATPARLEIAGNTVLKTPLQTSGFGTSSPSPAYSMLIVGNETTGYTTGTAYSNYWATVAITGGAVVTNNFHVGTRGLGAVYQHDSSAYLPCCANNDAQIGLGNGSYGYWGASNSVTTAYGYFSVARSPGSSAAIVQHGGNFTQLANRFRLSRGGDALFFLDDGGVADFSKTSDGFYLGDTDGNTGGSAVATVSGAGSRLVSSRIVGRMRDDFTTCINLVDGGTMDVAELTLSNPESDTKPFYLNFDGGVWKFPYKAWDYNSFVKIDEKFSRPTRITVYSRGVAFEVASSTVVNFTAPLCKPSGLSVTSIDLPTDAGFLAATHLGALRVTIEDAQGGSGAGASALMAFDDIRGVPDRIVVTSPGYGYSAGTKAYVHAMRGPTKWECAVQLGNVSCGGIVKRGEGTLVLKALNDLTGKTRIEGGNLRLVYQKSMPEGEPLEMFGGSLSAVTNAVRVTTLTGYGALYWDTSSGICSISDGLHMSAADLAANRRFTFSNAIPAFGSDATLTIDGLNELPEDTTSLIVATSSKGFTSIPTLANGGSDWKISLTADHKTLKVKRNTGCVIFFK